MILLKVGEEKRKGKISILKHVLLVDRNAQLEIFLPYLNTYSLLDTLKIYLMVGQREDFEINLSWFI